MLVEIGATRYSRVSRNLRSTSYSSAKPKPPNVCTHMSAAAQEASAASIFEIGRASCRERVCQYVWISVVAVSLKKKKTTLQYRNKRQKRQIRDRDRTNKR